MRIDLDRSRGAIERCGQGVFQLRQQAPCDQESQDEPLVLEKNSPVLTDVKGVPFFDVDVPSSRRAGTGPEEWAAR